MIYLVAERPMGRMLKYLIYLAVLGFVGLSGYAYIGPFLGADFEPTQAEMRTPVTLTAAPDEG